MTESAGTLCIGIDVTWWGGSPRKRSSQWEHLVSAVLEDPCTFSIEAVDLGGARNPDGRMPDQPNFDKDGKLLVDAISQILERHPRVQRCIVALDAPLEAAFRPGQLKRVKAVARGERAGSVRRECEQVLAQYAGGLSAPEQRSWNRDLKIQSGSPIAPRITSIIAQMQSLGFRVLRKAVDADSSRVLIEIFPSAAIWALGVLGCYRSATSEAVREYKKGSGGRSVEPAGRPLAGFLELLATCPLPPGTLPRWVEQLAAAAAQDSGCVPARTGSRDKSFDDLIESGLAFLTAVAFSQDCFHVWGGGHDGAIVGPGRFAPREF